MKKVFLSALFFLFGCVGLYDEPAYFNDNHQIYRAVCNGAGRDIGDCYALADKRCGGSFEIVEREREEIDAFDQSYKTTYFSYERDQEIRKENGYQRRKEDGNGHSNTISGNANLNLIKRRVYFYCK